jgi:hypothetical protein
MAVRRGSGLRGFPSPRKVRLTAQQAPNASPGLRLEHRLIKLCISKEAFRLRRVHHAV